MRSVRSITLLTVIAAACVRQAGPPVEQPLLAAAAAPEATFRTIDLMPLFFEFWDHDVVDAAGDSALLVQRFRERVILPHEAFYVHASGGASDDAWIRRFLGRVSADVPAMRVISARLGADLRRYRRSFTDSFPDFRYGGSVYFYPSLYVRDGGLMDFDNSVALMFGLDMIARVHGSDAELGVLFAHELFHIYHHQVNPATSPQQAVFRGVWGEGLATYVSGQLNPGASDLSLLLNDRRLIAALPTLHVLAARLLEDMDSTYPAVRRPYLQGGVTDSLLPPRAGYLLGLRVAQELGRTRTVRELARLDDATVRREMEAILRRIVVKGAGVSLAPGIDDS